MLQSVRAQGLGHGILYCFRMLRKSGRGAALVHLTSLSKAENEVSAAHTGQSFAFLQAYVLFL